MGETTMLNVPDETTTVRMTIRKILPRDARAIYRSYASDEEVSRYLTWRPHASVRDTVLSRATRCAARAPAFANSASSK